MLWRVGNDSLGDELHELLLAAVVEQLLQALLLGIVGVDASPIGDVALDQLEVEERRLADETVPEDKV